MLSKFSQFKTRNFQTISNEKMRNQSYISRWELQLYSWWLFHLKSFVVLKLCFKFSQFEIQICETTSDGETSKTKVVDLEKLYNFIVDDFFIWNNLYKKKSREFPHIWNSNFFQTKSDENKLYIKVVDIDEINNFIVDDFFIWKHLWSQNSVW